jgi:hypothetical protein
VHPLIGRLAAVLFLAGGLSAMVIGGGALMVTWHAGQTWAESDEADRASRELSSERPRWVDDPADVAPGGPASASGGPVAAAARPTSDGSPSADRAERSASGADRLTAGPGLLSQEAGPTDRAESNGPTEQRAPPEAITLVESDFRFIDPPEPGARARITVTVRNGADLPSDPILVVLPTPWLAGWQVIEADPPVLDDREISDKRRVFVFPSLPPNSERALVLGMVATDDAVDPPDLRLALDRGPEPGPEIGQARPTTVAPRPRPGRARTVEIPSLALRAAVVPTAWEPPPWVVGQIDRSANLTEGNTVLIGHLNGLVGNVFSGLNRVKRGDVVIATSRGLDYFFVVSEVLMLPGSQSLPIEPSPEPRLTLMTCTGVFDPIRQDYSHRLWVIAEPPEQAKFALEGGPGPLERQYGALVAPPPSPVAALASPVVAVASPTADVAAAAEADATPVAAAPVAEAPTVEPAAVGPVASEAPVALGPSPKGAAPTEEAPAPPPPVVIREPAPDARVGRRAIIKGALTEDADPTLPVWLVVRADVEGSRWWLYREPLRVRKDGSWEVELEIGGGAGIHHTILVAPVDAESDVLLRRFVAEHPNEPLPTLPEVFEGGARLVVERG